MREYVLGIDIGGTNTVCGIVDREGNIIYEFSIPTGSAQSPEELGIAIHNRFKEYSSDNSEVSLFGIGIGAPNGNYYSGTIDFAPNLKWDGVIELARIFEDIFNSPCVLTNDANAAALGEKIYGHAKNVKDYIFITLGTGLGSGIVCNGNLVYGHDGFAGEIGHAIVYQDGRPCGCGRNGCLETYASATGICTTVRQFLKESDLPSSLREVPTEGLSAKIIADSAANGDEIALRAFDFTGRILGWKLADAVTFTSPEAIYLFGGLANSGNLLLKPTKKYFEEALLKIYKGKVRLEISKLQNKNAAVLGAAALMWNENNTQ